MGEKIMRACCAVEVITLFLIVMSVITGIGTSFIGFEGGVAAIAWVIGMFAFLSNP